MIETPYDRDMEDCSMEDCLLSHRRAGVGQKNGQPDRKKNVLVFDDFPIEGGGSPRP